jgi:hypothetical protein
MRLARLAAVAALAFTITGSAFAASEADKNASPQGPSTQDPMVLGWDIHKAGKTDQERVAFWKTMTPDQQATAKSKCSPALIQAEKNASPAGPDSQDPMVLQLAFCKAVMH